MKVTVDSFVSPLRVRTSGVLKMWWRGWNVRGLMLSLPLLVSKDSTEAFFWPFTTCEWMPLLSSQIAATSGSLPAWYRSLWGVSWWLCLDKDSLFLFANLFSLIVILFDCI